MPIVLDPDGRLARAWGVRSLPTSFVVDREGEIRTVEVGYTTELGLRARLWLARVF
jgi:alkyl hydroperoxide reductase subunit AhpC